MDDIAAAIDIGSNTVHMLAGLRDGILIEFFESRR
jgi:exopolyphosphatase/pppGpp-phosphohydrolase